MTTSTVESAPAASRPSQKLALPILTAMVIGSMVGSGIFSLPRTFGQAIIAWCFAAGCMYILTRVFPALVERRPELWRAPYRANSGSRLVRHGCFNRIRPERFNN